MLFYSVYRRHTMKRVRFDNIYVNAIRFPELKLIILIIEK